MMSQSRTEQSRLGGPIPRVLGRFNSGRTGPTLVILSCLHGNEPAGVEAVRRVLARIEELKLPVRGEFVAFSGNIAAHRANVRFVDEDLNRIWTTERISRLRQNQHAGTATSEAREQADLFQLLIPILGRRDRELYFLDLHTTSARSAPFAIIADTLRNRAFARNFPIPIILGLEEQIDGALLEYLGSKGAVTMGFEAGRHQDRASVDRSESILWLALVAAGNLVPDHCPDLATHTQRLREATAQLPRFLEVRHRHGILPEDGYRMEEGFENFQQVKAGQLLGKDSHGPVLSPELGRVLMPLYQELGSDGFFIVRGVRPFWLRLSRSLRRLKLDVLLVRLPGVMQHPERADTLLVNPRIARWKVTELFHLLGYRRRGLVDGRPALCRREYDMVSPFE